MDTHQVPRCPLPAFAALEQPAERASLLQRSAAARARSPGDEAAPRTRRGDGERVPADPPSGRLLNAAHARGHGLDYATRRCPSLRREPGDPARPRPIASAGAGARTECRVVLPRRLPALEPAMPGTQLRQGSEPASGSRDVSVRW